LVFLAAAPVAALALWSISQTAMDLTDRCASWDYPLDQPISVHVAPDDPCRSRSGHAESKAAAALRTALVPGVLLIASLVAIDATARSLRGRLIAAGIAMLAETLVVFTIAPLTLVVGVCLILLSRRLPPPRLAPTDLVNLPL
jgi:hypothetical protein